MASLFLLATKLGAPARPSRLLARPHLVMRLHEISSCRLGVISAPAGFGKSTLLSAWAADATVPVGWVTLDAGDNDPVRFWTYVIAALQTICPDVGEGTLAQLQSPQRPPFGVWLPLLLNDLAACARPLALVLDDYHVVRESALHEAVVYFVDHMPSHVHLIIATREDPPFPLSRLRARRQLVEIRAADLALSTQEGALLLNDLLHLGLTEEQVTALVARTEGWIAGLQLAALSLQACAEPAAAIREFAGTQRFILDYLLEEVLACQPDEVQAFLLETSILGRLSGSLCDAVTGRTDSQDMLISLERHNLFLVALDAERTWYRYHHLFADLLQARLGTAESERVRELHLRAATWFDIHGDPDAAVHHAMAAGDPDRVAALVRSYGRPLLVRGELGTLLTWLQALPEAVIAGDARLGVLAAWGAALAGQGLAAEAFLRNAELASGPDGSAPIRGDVAAIRSYLAGQQGDYARCIRLAHEAMARLGADEQVVRSVVSFTLGGAALLLGELPEAARAFAEAATQGWSAGNQHLAVAAWNSLAALQVMQGQLSLAEATIHDASNAARSGAGRVSPAVSAFAGTLAEIAYERNRLEEARTLLRQGIELGRAWGNPESLLADHVWLAYVLQLLGDGVGAGQALAAAHSLYLEGHISPLARYQYAAVRARMALEALHADEAKRWLEAVGIEAVGPFGASGEYVRARLELLEGRLQAALERARELVTRASIVRLPAVAIRGLLVQALALHGLGDAQGAEASLEEALELAEPEGYLRPFAELRTELEPLVRTWEAQRSDAPALRGVKLLLGAGGPSSNLVQAGLVEALSQRELEVLRKAAEGLSNQQIAQTLFIAESTVKSHLNTVFGKLGVRSRTQAVARARDLELL